MVGNRALEAIKKLLTADTYIRSHDRSADRRTRDTGTGTGTGTGTDTDTDTDTDTERNQETRSAEDQPDESPQPE